MYFYFVLYYLKCVCLLSITASQIVRHPVDTDALVGGDTTLYCTVENIGSDTVVWILDTGTVWSENRTITAPSFVDHDRLKVTGNNANGTYNLEITGLIKDTDRHGFQCAIRADPSVVDGAYSNVSLLNIYDLPDAPTCWTSMQPQQAGESVAFTCRFASILTEVNMSLDKNGDTLTDSIVNPIDFASSISSTFNVTSNDDGAVLRCTVMHQVFNMPYECTAPLSVTYIPIVEITPRGTLSHGNASFTCNAVSNPNPTQLGWSVCYGNMENECYDTGNGTLTVQIENSTVSECEMFGTNVSCYVFKNGDEELPVYVLLNQNMTIPDNVSVNPCSLKCSVNNDVGEGNDIYIIPDYICVKAMVITTVTLTTVMSTTQAPPTTTFAESARPTDRWSTTGNTPFVSNESAIMDYYYIIGGFAAGTVFLFIVTIIIMICRKGQTETETGSSITSMQWADCSNGAYKNEDNGGFEEPKEAVYSSDNPFKTFGKGKNDNDTTSSDKKVDSTSNVNDDMETRSASDTLPMSDITRREPDGHAIIETAEERSYSMPTVIQYGDIVEDNPEVTHTVTQI